MLYAATVLFFGYELLVFVGGARLVAGALVGCCAQRLGRLAVVRRCQWVHTRVVRWAVSLGPPCLS